MPLYKSHFTCSFPYVCVHVVVENIFCCFPFFLYRVESSPFLSLSLLADTVRSNRGLIGRLVYLHVHTQRERPLESYSFFSLFFYFISWMMLSPRRRPATCYYSPVKFTCRVVLTMFSSSSFRSCVRHYRAAAAEEEKKSSTLTARCVKDDRGGTKKRN